MYPPLQAPPLSFWDPRVRLLNQWKTVTLGEVGENGPTMKKVYGTPVAKGMSVDFLRKLRDDAMKQGKAAKYIDLSVLLQGHTKESIPDAAVLVLRVDEFMNDPDGETKLNEEVSKMPIDKKRLDTYSGKVVPSTSRYNNTMDDCGIAPDIATGQGTTVNFKDYPTVDKLRRLVADSLGVPKLVAELNVYPDSAKSGITWHGDRERKLVVGGRFGKGANGAPLRYQWYKKDAPIGKEGVICLKSGDLYFMSEKAVGFDCKNHSILTLRHAAGKDTYKDLGTKRKVDEDGAIHPSAIIML